MEITYDNGQAVAFELQMSESWTSQLSKETFAVIKASDNVLAAQFSMYDSQTTMSDPALTILRPVCKSSYNSVAFVSLPYYFDGQTLKLMPTLDITVMVGEKDLPNFRVYTMVSNEGYTEYCTGFEVQVNQYLNYSLLHIPSGNHKNLLLYGRFQADIYVYSRAVKFAESHSSVAGYWSESIPSIEHHNLYCGQLQTTPSPTTTQELTSAVEYHTSMPVSVSETGGSSTTTSSLVEEVTSESEVPETIAFTESTVEQSMASETVIIEQTSKKPITSDEWTQLNEGGTSETITMQGTSNTASTFEETTDVELKTATMEYTTIVKIAETVINSIDTTTSVHLSKNGSDKVTYKFKPYVVPDIMEIYEPVESTLSNVLGGGSCCLVIIFLVTIVIIDLPHLKAHFCIFLRNVKSMFFSTRRRNWQRKRKYNDSQKNEMQRSQFI